MTEATNNAELAAAELEDLKERAALMGVKFHPSISAEKLREKIKEHQAAAAAAEGAGSADDAGVENAQKAAKTESEGARLARIRAEAEKLVRIRVTCMNPSKKDWAGEIFTVGNRAVGTLKKYVPFNADDGWHVPNMIYQHLKVRQCQVFVTEKVKNGVGVRRGKLIKEFAIEVLDPLTRDEIAELARRQAMANGETV